MDGREATMRGWIPSAIGDPMDDPVLRAVADAKGESFRFGDAGSFRRVWKEVTGLGPREVVAMADGTGMGTAGGYAQVAFGNREILYLRSDGTFRVVVPTGWLPQTALHSMRGCPLSRIVDVPGIGHWLVRRADELNDETHIHLLPRPPEEAKEIP